MSAGILSVMVAAGFVLIFIGLAGFVFTVPTFIEMNGDVVSLHPILQKAVLCGMIFSLPVAGIGVCLVAYGGNDEVRYTACMEDMKDRDYCDSRHFVVRTHNEGKTQNAVTVNGL
jgi:hypothetical protein